MPPGVPRGPWKAPKVPERPRCHTLRTPVPPRTIATKRLGWHGGGPCRRQLDKSRASPLLECEQISSEHHLCAQISKPDLHIQTTWLNTTQSKPIQAQSAWRA
eukprot:7885487-Pyramimonas_sp.AAC.2